VSHPTFLAVFPLHNRWHGACLDRVSIIAINRHECSRRQPKNPCSTRQVRRCDKGRERRYDEDEACDTRLVMHTPKTAILIGSGDPAVGGWRAVDICIGPSSAAGRLTRLPCYPRSHSSAAASWSDRLGPISGIAFSRRASFHPIVSCGSVQAEAGPRWRSSVEPDRDGAQSCAPGSPTSSRRWRAMSDALDAARSISPRRVLPRYAGAFPTSPSEHTAASNPLGAIPRLDGKVPSLSRAFLHNSRATLTGSMPSCPHHARSSPAR
jgi:hypothetical protein